MEIVFTEPSRSQTPQIIQVDQPSQAPKEKPKKEVQFKSDQTRRTELETWKRPEQLSPMQAPIQSSAPQGQEQQQQQKEPEKEQANQMEFDEESEYGLKHTDEDRKPLPLPGFAGSAGRPAVAEAVNQQMPPGVRLGNVTSLNTDQYQFYSFHQRLISRLVPIWGGMVRRAVYNWIQEGDVPPISKTWVTNVEVIMDPSGEVLDVQPMRLSGFWDIDQAAIKSFEKIKKVPNPPKEMVDENGYIHLQFQTEVIWIPQPNVRYHGGGPGN